MNESKRYLNNGTHQTPGQEHILLHIPKATGMAYFLLLSGFLLLFIGFTGQESAAVLTGAILLFIIFSSYLGVFFISLLRHKYTTILSAQLVPRETRNDIKITAEVSPYISQIHFPWILSRYEIVLKTKDNRKTHQVLDPYRRQKTQCSFIIPERGAYYGNEDFLTTYDVFGLFSVSYPVVAEKNARILIQPALLQESEQVALKSGGNAHRQESHYHKTDDLTDSRPYIPGDDPRRINWKLFGHSGSLFVREGEPEPPPESQCTIILDTSYDLHELSEARRAVDGLCKTALYMLSDLHNRGISTSIGYNNSECRICSPREAVQLLSYPAAIPATEFTVLPAAQEQRLLLILALPGNPQNKTSLEVYLKQLHARPESSSKADIWFLYDDARFKDAASECARYFSGKGGIYARSVRL